VRISRRAAPVLTDMFVVGVARAGAPIPISESAQRARVLPLAGVTSPDRSILPIGQLLAGFGAGSRFDQAIGHAAHS